MKALVILLCAAFVVLWAYAQGLQWTGLLAIAAFTGVMVAFFYRKTDR